MSSKKKLQFYLDRMERELDRAMDFWITHSPDMSFGGFFNCVGRDGKVYDTDKYGWLQARQVWMYCKLYNETEKYHKDNVLQDAISGGEFIMKHLKRSEDGRCYFQVTREGKPVKIQRKLFTECFYAMAMAELGRATGNLKYTVEGESMLSRLIHWARVDDSDLGLTKLAGDKPVNSMAVPMMMLCVIDNVCAGNQALRSDYAVHEDWATQQILQHVQRDGKAILENVSPDGTQLPGYQGRLMNPGHAIEAGWFLLQRAIKTADKTLSKTAIQRFIVDPFDQGWDKDFGGIFYFLDVDGLSPVPLEWNMKLWWVHSEALIALLMAYQETGKASLLDMFDQVFEYSFGKFSDPEFGEWWGYLDRQGDPTHSFKGGPYKGCFHLPRCLHMCIKMLKSLLKNNGPRQSPVIKIKVI
ncbi:predicted protein [Nematostella vectensis]|uniref:N-acylglucosamine 2-epimerase n=1 Tax=Nematostella vectensis TaxID=45351 RepID=A7SET6_NEMVE|nr:predicted protein [Nematostella vectensis]|eukprot:XP_001629853.1 predicted protein [Nematostella vectensis]